MALSPLVFMTLCAISTVLADTVPVLMWGASSGSTPALNNPQARLIEAVSKSPLTLVFVEDKLSAEDISLCKVEVEGSCFSYLSGVQTKSYSQVSSPLDRIEDVVENVKYVHADANGKLDMEIPLKDFSVVVVSLAQDPELSREENLERHDALINKIYNQVVADVGSDKVLALYTGKSSGNLVRKARQAASTTAAPAQSSSTSTTTAASAATPTPAQSVDVIFTQPEMLIYYTSLTYTDAKKSTTNLKATGVTISNKNDSAFQVTMKTDEGDISFKVSNGENGYWGVSDVQFKDNIAFRTDRTVGAADGFSYYCGPATSYTSVNNTELKWMNLQLQPAFSNSSALKKFSDPYNCVGFTSIPIWSGLFVTVVLLLIMSAGITWLMDIRTMDRFDDPKGKTISINTLE